MAETVDITGRWSGFYSQHGHDNPITAIFAQFESHLQGKMTDGVTSVEKSVFEAALDAGLPPGADEQIVARLRKEYPDAPRVPIRAMSWLPEFSTLEGEVQGRGVRFKKEYIGDHFSGWRIGDQLIGQTITDLVVHYAGMLSDDGRHLEGRWWIATSGEKPASRIEGTFQLSRQDD
jgi:hypothetical protein